MAFPTTVYLSYGQEKVESSEQKQKLGTRAVTPDGRVFYYAKCSSTAITPAGKIVDGIAAVAAHDMDVAAAATAAGKTTFTSGTSLTNDQESVCRWVRSLQRRPCPGRGLSG